MRQLYMTNDPPASDDRPLSEHIFGEAEGWLCTFTARQARLVYPNARANELVEIEQLTHPYPHDISRAAAYLREQDELGRDCYFGVHLFVEPGSRRSNNALPLVQCLWLDEDRGHFPETGPEPTAIVHSSAERRHLYWRLERPVSTEWAVGLNRRIAAWAGGDVGKAGLTTVLRVPGTHNYKRHPAVDKVQARLTGLDAWSPEIMEQAVPLPPEPSREECKRSYNGPRPSLG